MQTKWGQPLKVEKLIAILFSRADPVIYDVRFRYDAATRQRLKTVELIIERTDWEPPPEKLSVDTVVALHIEGYETELRKKVKTVGGKWNPEKLLWFVRYGDIAGTELEKHIHIDASV